MPPPEPFRLLAGVLARPAWIRSRRAEAGSSSGSWGTSWPAKALLQDGLAEGIGAGEAGVDLPVQQFGGLKAGVEKPNDLGLFGGGADRNFQILDL